MENMERNDWPQGLLARPGPGATSAAGLLNLVGMLANSHGAARRFPYFPYYPSFPILPIAKFGKYGMFGNCGEYGKCGKC